MDKEEIKKTFRRIEIDKSNDSCGFEFADGFDCTFDNIATCYDDRLKLYDLVKELQQENNQLKEQRQELRSWLEEQCNQYGKYERWQFEETLDKLNELEGKNERTNNDVI